MTDSREKFEAHMLRLNACTRMARQQTDGSYRTISVQRAWQLWQESRMQALRDFVAEQCRTQACNAPTTTKGPTP